MAQNAKRPLKYYVKVYLTKHFNFNKIPSGYWNKNYSQIDYKSIMKRDVSKRFSMIKKVV